MSTRGTADRVRKAFRAAASPAISIAAIGATAVVLGVEILHRLSVGAEWTSRAVYGSPWFLALLAFAGLHLACAVASAVSSGRRGFTQAILLGGLLLSTAGVWWSGVAGVRGRITLREGESTSRFEADLPALFVADRAGGEPVEVALDPHTFRGVSPAVTEGPVHDLGGGATLTVLRYEPDMIWRREVEPGLEADGPAVLVSLTSDENTVSTWILAGERLPIGPRSVTLRIAASQGDLRALLDTSDSADSETAAIEVILGPSAELYVRLSWPGSRTLVQSVALRDRVDTIWPDTTLVIDSLLPHARVRRTPARPPTPRANPTPALLVRIAAAGDAAEAWLEKGAPSVLNAGGRVAEVRFGDRSIPLGFRLSLHEFIVKTWPGGRLPRAFENHVTVEAPGRAPFARVIRIGEPLVLGGFRLHPWGYTPGEGDHASVLEVRRDPGRHAVLLGLLLASIGALFRLPGLRADGGDHG